MKICKYKYTYIVTSRTPAEDHSQLSAALCIKGKEVSYMVAELAPAAPGTLIKAQGWRPALFHRIRASLFFFSFSGLTLAAVHSAHRTPSSFQ